MGAAALAFYLTISAFPALIIIISLALLLPVAKVDNAILSLVSQSLPGESAAMVVRVVREALDVRSPGLFSISLLGMLWAASTGMHAVIRKINRVYHVSDGRGFIHNRLLALGLSVVFGATTLAAFSLLVLGGIAQDWVSRTYGFNEPLVWIFAIFRWGVVIFTLMAAFTMVYRFGPNIGRSFLQIAPGVACGVTVLIGSSIVFRHLTSSLLDYNLVYGSIASVVVMMLWLYIVGLVILLGAELNAFLEQ